MSSAPEPENRFAPPTAHVEDIQGANALAGRGARLGAAIIDGLLQAAIFYALAFGLVPALVPAQSLGAMSFGHTFVQFVVSFGLFAAIQGYLLATQGQTIGKNLVGLRILRSDGSRATVGRLLGLRYLVGWLITVIPLIGMLFGVADCLAIFRASRKCLHDNIADTIVVNA